MKAGTETGSLINHVLTHNVRQPEPKVNDPATICAWTDRYAATVVEVLRFKSGKKAGQIKAVVVQRDTAKLVDGSWASENQRYEYSCDCNAPLEVFPVRGSEFKNGSGSLVIGFRQEYRDPSF